MTARVRSSRRFDAVLLDAGHTFLFLDADAVCRVLAEVDVPMEPARFLAADRRARLRFDRLLGSGAQDSDAFDRTARVALLHEELGLEDVEARRRAQQAVRRLHEQHGLYRRVPADVRQGLHRLRDEGYPLAVVSNAEGNIEALLAATGLAGLFEVVLDSQVVGVEKPDPRIFRMALERLGVAPDRAVHAGDLHARDVVGARAAGIEAVLVDEDGAHFARDVVRVRSIAELPDVLAGWPQDP